MMAIHYMKAVFGGIGMAFVVTGGNLLVDLLIKRFNGNAIYPLISVKHLILFLIVLLLSTSYLSTRKPDRN